MESVPVHDTVEVKVGDRVPGFIFRDTAKQKMSLKQFKGKYVVIDVWASWCYPCKKEYPTLRRLSKEYKNIVLNMTLNILDMQMISCFQVIEMFCIRNPFVRT